MFDMLNMLGKVKDIQAKIQKTKEELQSTSLKVSSDDGHVEVTVSGKREIISIKYAEALIATANAEKIEAETKNAINKALTQVDQKIATELKKSTEGLIPNIPGLDLNSLLGAS